ncbi:MAG: methionine--tRNA ligase [Rhodospirillales bacterium]|nr:methionine--tRNA ligase [Rhodospirillales bacterium]
MTEKTFYITTPIYYVNGDPHMGHVYCTIACDVLARFKRLDGYHVHFLTGTDEHGLKVYQAARDKNMSAQELTDVCSAKFRALKDQFNLSNDDFIRTTEDRHKKGAQALWTKLEQAGDIYLDKYAGWYAVRDEAYYNEDELFDDEQGIKRARPTGAEVKWVEEESYFFKLSAWQDRLIKFYEEHPDFIAPSSRKNEILSFVKGGLKDLSISRTTFDWGVPVPGNEKHVMYVWIDALANYITALGYPDESAPLFKEFWPADIHAVGKEITRFHCVYWPAFLMSAGVLPPKQVFATGWMTVEGEKMSKSVGNVIAPETLLERYGLDGSRFVLLRIAPFGNDCDFSHTQAINLINAELANGLGNLVQRTLSMIVKNCDSKIARRENLTAEDQSLLDLAYAMVPDVRAEFDAMRLHKGLEVIWKVVSAANGYIDAQAPWALKKTDPARMAVVLSVLAEVIRCLGLITQPLMPDSAAKILDQVSTPLNQRDFTHLSPDYALPAGTKIPVPQGVFPRLIEEEAA